MNILVEDWGGKVQSHDISALKGTGVEELLEKIMLEAELLELKANPDKAANGSVIEARLDKGKGYITTLLVQNGNLSVGDYFLAGQYSGKVRALYDERGNQINSAGPSVPPGLQDMVTSSGGSFADHVVATRPPPPPSLSLVCPLPLRTLLVRTLALALSLSLSRALARSLTSFRALFACGLARPRCCPSPADA